jgi:hypothetical protein
MVYLEKTWLEVRADGSHRSGLQNLKRKEHHDKCEGCERARTQETPGRIRRSEHENDDLKSEEGDEVDLYEEEGDD